MKMLANLNPFLGWSTQFCPLFHHFQIILGYHWNLMEVSESFDLRSLHDLHANTSPHKLPTQATFNIFIAEALAPGSVSGHPNMPCPKMPQKWHCINLPHPTNFFWSSGGCQLLLQGLCCFSYSINCWNVYRKLWTNIRIIPPEWKDQEQLQIPEIITEFYVLSIFEGYHLSHKSINPTHCEWDRAQFYLLIYEGTVVRLCQLCASCGPIET